MTRGTRPGSGRPRAVRAVFLMTDTTRWDMLGCYRETGIATPNLDRLAREGLRFERAYTCSPVCGSARSALFTGTWPHTNGALANSMALAADAHTIGERLSSQGVHAAYIGKWHLDGTDYFGNGHCPPGWDPRYWYNGRCYPEELAPGERARSRDPHLTKREGIAPEFTYAHRCSDRAIEFLGRCQNESFFLVISYDEPHGPSISPAPFAHAYEDYELPKSRNVWDTLAGKPEHQRVWAGERLHADRDAVRIRHPSFFGCQSHDRGSEGQSP